MANVFISYRRTDAVRVEQLVTAIQAHGIDVWWDRSLEQNAEFGALIREEIAKAGAVVVCWSDAAAESRWVVAEADEADYRKKYVGCMIGPGRAPPPFNTMNNANLAEWQGRADDPQLLMLLEKVGRLIGRPDVAERASSQRRSQSETTERKQRENEAAQVQQEQERLRADDLARQKAMADRLRPGAVWRDVSSKLPADALPEMMTLPKGSFERATGEAGMFAKKFYTVTIDRVIAIGKFPVVRREWDFAAPRIIEGDFQAKLEHNNVIQNLFLAGRQIEGEARGRYPVAGLKRNFIENYILRLNQELGLVGRPDAYRLPSEGEWEFACRANTKTDYYWGNKPNAKNCNFDIMTPVGSYPPNGFGLYDMHGRHGELVSDVPSYSKAGHRVPEDATPFISGPQRTYVMHRGGGLNCFERYIEADLETASGFRLARTLLPS